MIRDEEVYQIGRIGKAHGVKGEVTMQVDDDVFDRVDADYVVMRIDGILVPFFFEEYRFRTDTTALVKFCDIDDMQHARRLTGCDVFFPRDMVDDDEQLSWAAIFGYSICDASNGKAIGILTGIDDNTANILFNVETVEGKNLLLPAAEPLIENIDNEARRIDYRVPDGLLELA